MLSILAFIYGLIVMFVLTSASRNVRARRPHGTTLAIVGWGTMSASFVGATLALAFAAGLLNH